jgi:DNA polymerase-1
MGRRRYLPDLNSKQIGFRSSAERQAFNTRIQGTAADIIKLAMVRAHQMIPEGAKLILTVHDELVTLTPDALVDDTVKAIREAMEGIKLLPIPLVADITVVDKWGDAK